jgi:putative phosphoribosyl transferase
MAATATVRTSIDDASAGKRYLERMASHSRLFEDRRAAGVALARELQKRVLQKPIVLALPRGGVAVAHEVARMIRAPLDVIAVRKIGMPGQPELAIGAIASGGIVVHEPRMKQEFPDSDPTFNRLADEQRIELEHRERLYRAGLAPLDLRGRTAILVDDGLATGSTMLAAIRAAHQAGADAIMVAAPVASREAAKLVRAEVDAVLILETPPVFLAIGEWYRNFEQLDDAEVCRLLGVSGQPVEDSRIIPHSVV